MKTDDITAVIEREVTAARTFLGPGESAQTALLPILRALQEAHGHIQAHSLPLIAHALNISQAEVRGVVSFYHDFRIEPAGAHVLKLCRAEACQAMGCDALADRLERDHALKPGETSADGALTLESVYCLGNCALAPAALLDGELIGRVNAAQIDAICAGARR